MRRADRHPRALLLCCLVGSLWWLCERPTTEAAPSSPPALNEKELAGYRGKGRGTVTGQAFLSSPSGKAISQAGVPVHLIPLVPYTRHWFERNVRVTDCGAKDGALPAEGTTTARGLADCFRDSLLPLLTDKRLAPYLRTTRANPTGHFWFTKIPAGRYYLVSIIEGSAGPHQDERAAGIAWLTIDLEAGEKATNLVVTNCRSSLC
jgi:hypothetical protein